MAYDTSILRKDWLPEIHRRLELGETAEAIAADYGLTRDSDGKALLQFARKFDADGRQVARNGPAEV